MPSILKLTPRHERIYDFILNFKQDHDGVSPTVLEICSGCEIRSSSVVCHCLTTLELLGMVKCGYGTGRRSRMISIPGGRWVPPFSIPTTNSPTKQGARARISSSPKS